MDITPVGFDLGNGTTSISLHGKVSKVPSGFSNILPLGAIGKKGARVKPKAFSLITDDGELWFGQDALSVRMHREIDQDKYDSDYIKTMFSAIVAKAIRQHKIVPDTIGRMNVVCSMPPESWQDSGIRNAAESAYREVFNAKSQWRIRGNKFKPFRIYTRFGGIQPEALSYAKAFGLKPDYTVITDIGSGTVDYIVFGDNVDNPLLVKSQNDGLLHAYEEVDSVNFRTAELNLIRGDTDRRILSPYFNEIKLQLSKICRRLDTGGKTINLVLIGGGCKLMTADVKASFRKSFSRIVIKDEFTNVRANARLAV